jgi:hypothetical protein
MCIPKRWIEELEYCVEGPECCIWGLDRSKEYLCSEFRLRSTRAIGGLSAVEAQWYKIFLQVP